MSKVQIYDRAMCCSTGVCGPQVDPVLPQFSADLDWLKSQGHEVVRFNLAQDPVEFTKNTAVQELLNSEGVECLPLVFVDEQVVSRTNYPTRENLALWTKSSLNPASTLPVVTDAGECCGDSDCC